MCSLCVEKVAVLLVEAAFGEIVEFSGAVEFF
jgi:hypothetical protein